MRVSSINFFQKKEKHLFHLVDSSPLPLLVSISVFLIVCSFIMWFHPPMKGLFVSVLVYSCFVDAWSAFSFILAAWFVTVLIESENGHHTLIVRSGLRYGMALFIVSEILFFFAFFWAFFHVSLSPSIAIGCVWPPKSIQALNIWELPLTNTLLLLSSGFATTFAHKAILASDNTMADKKFANYLLIAILLGIIFLCCQMLEYKYGITFSWKENIYGSTFFVTTGFHGLHVTIGTIFLIFCLARTFIARLVDELTHLAFNPPLFSTATIKQGQIVSAEIGPLFPFQSFLSRAKKFLIDSIATEHKLWGLFFRVQNTPLSLVNFPFRFTKEQHLGFEAAAWYWHFVDVVWIFLFLTVYWWGSY